MFAVVKFFYNFLHKCMNEENKAFQKFKLGLFSKVKRSETVLEFTDNEISIFDEWSVDELFN